MVEVRLSLMLVPLRRSASDLRVSGPSQGAAESAECRAGRHDARVASVRRDDGGVRALGRRR